MCFQNSIEPKTAKLIISCCCLSHTYGDGLTRKSLVIPSPTTPHTLQKYIYAAVPSSSRLHTNHSIINDSTSDLLFSNYSVDRDATPKKKKEENQDSDSSYNEEIMYEFFAMFCLFSIVLSSTSSYNEDVAYYIARCCIPHM